MSTQYFVYIWENKRNGKKYIGSHKGNVDDGYVGSGIYFKRAYKKEPEKFVRDIICFCENEEEMKKTENLILIENDAADSDLFYNITNFSSGGNLHDHLSEERKKEIYALANEKSIKKIEKMTPEERDNLKRKKQETWKNSPKKDIHSKRTSERRKLEESEKTDKEKKEFSNLMKDAYWSRSEEEIREQHRKQSEGVKKSYENNPKLLEERTEHLRKVNVGRIYVNKDGASKRIYPEDKEQYIKKGWSLGMGKRKKNS